MLKDAEKTNPGVKRDHRIVRMEKDIDHRNAHSLIDLDAVTIHNQFNHNDLHNNDKICYPNFVERISRSLNDFGRTVIKVGNNRIDERHIIENRHWSLH
jgi:hypothetical protein